MGAAPGELPGLEAAQQTSQAKSGAVEALPWRKQQPEAGAFDGVVVAEANARRARRLTAALESRYPNVVAATVTTTPITTGTAYGSNGFSCRRLERAPWESTPRAEPCRRRDAWLPDQRQGASRVSGRN